MDTILEVKGLTKNFGGLRAVNGVDFSISRNQIVGVIGPNGAGKTTLFNLLTGFLQPTTGKILFMKENVTGLKPHELVNLGITRTFQIVRPFRQLSVLENVTVACLSKRVTHRTKSRRSSQIRCMEILDRVGLREKAELLAADLSHGDLKRMEVARALATEPDILLLDEPFSGLATQEIDPLMSVIQELNEGGLTIIIIEHKLRELMKLVERVITVNFGELIADGTPEEIARNKDVIRAYLGGKGDTLVTS